MKRLELICISALVLACGCQSLNTGWTSKLPWSSKKVQDSKYQTPTRLAAIWSPDVITEMGKPPVRGFGGRFYFYNAQNQPVPVEGQLVIYAYDDTGVARTEGKSPDRKFAFTPDQFTRHFGESALGASYSVWIPWDEADGERRSISLLPVFTTTSGQIVMGQQALNVLPGKQSAAQPSQINAVSWNKAPVSGVQPVGLISQDIPAETQVPQASLRTTTIELPLAMRQRLSAPAGTPAPSLPARDPRTIQPATNAAANYAAATAAVNGAPTEYLPEPLPQPAMYQGSPMTGQPQVRSEHPRSPAPAAPNDPAHRAGFGWRRHPATPLFGHPFSH